jgi:NAD+ synthase
LIINPQTETEKIVTFLQKTLQKQKKQKVVLGLSGGIDSTTSLFLLTKTLPAKNIHIVYMPYFTADLTTITDIVKRTAIPLHNLTTISIKDSVDTLQKTLQIKKNETLRLGNIMARVRMITLFDIAKTTQALVCGTENKSEYHLAYYTRFGDEASDIEPLRHLYKTQIYEIAKFLHIPQFVIEAKPTAGLWTGQMDETEFGFTYKEADSVMCRYFDQKEPLKQIQLQFPAATLIITRCLQNAFKHAVPYTL